MNYMQEQLQKAVKMNEAMHYALSGIGTHELIASIMEKESVRIYAEDHGLCPECGVPVEDCDCN
jgi:hypothetical protein